MKRKLTSIAGIIGLFTALALLALVAVDVVKIVLNTLKGGGPILDLLKSTSTILQICIIVFSIVSLGLNAVLSRAFKFDKPTFKEKFATIIAAIVLNILTLAVFVAFVTINHSVENIVEVSILGVTYLTANVLYLIALIRCKKSKKVVKKPAKKKRKAKPSKKENPERYTFKDKAQDLLLLIDLRDSMAITQEEYERLKEEILKAKIIN